MSAEPFSCVVVGEEALLVECTRLLLARGHTVTAVVSPSDDLLGWARAEGLAAVPFGPDLAERLAPLRFDYLFSIANLRILPDEVLALPARLPVNFHDGPLPRHAGLFATSWAILDGDKQHGVTWHVMTSEADTGDVLKQRAVPVGPAATVHDLDVACFEAGIESFAELVDELAAGTATRTPQDLGLRSYHGKYDGLPRAGLFDWQRPAAELDALVRATAFGRRRNDFGTALLALGDDPGTGQALVAVQGVEVTDRLSTAEPGTVVDATPQAITVATVDRDVRLTALAWLTGERVDLVALAGTLATRHAGRFTGLTEDEVARLAADGRAAHRAEGRWLRVLAQLEPVLPPRFGRLGELGQDERPVGPVVLQPLRAAAADPAPLALAAVLAFLARLCRGGERDVALPVPGGAPGGLLAAELPLRAPEELLERTLPELAEQLGAELAALRSRPPYRRDLLLRHPQLAGAARAALPVAVLLPGSELASTDRALVIRIDSTGEVFFQGSELTDAQQSWLGAHFALLLAAAAAEPAQPLGRLPLLTAAERALLLDAWNDTAEEYPSGRTVTGLVADLACAAPAAPALRFADRELSYGELDQSADQLARRLIDLGAGPGSLVGVYLERSPELLISLLAVLKTGAAYVPIDPIYPPARIGHMLADSGARLVLTDEALSATLAAFPVTPVLAAPRSAPEQAPVEPVDRSVPEAPAYVIYTSGSTGVPKGVQVGHRALVNFLWTMARRPGFGSQDSLLALTTVCFDIAGLELYLPLVRGGTVEVLPAAVAADGFALREVVERSAPTVLQATPTTWQMLLAAGWPGDPRLRALCGGEPLPTALAEQLVTRVGELYNMYGPTETTIWSTVERVHPGAPVTVGRPIGNTRCHVLDERGLPVPPGIPGELYIAGDGVADGYLGRPELTAERFVTAPGGTGRAYRTGDLVRHLPDGRLEYLERIDGQIKLNGFRIELGEVESALRRLPEVTAAVALVREDQPGERRLVAYATGTAALAPPAGLREALREGLPGYMVPAAVVVLPQLPLTPNGKIDRKALPRPGVARIAGGAAAVRTGLERRIAEVWCEALGLDWVGAEDNFFDLGGDSLKLTSVAAVLRERLGRPVTRLDMFGHPSVRAMAAHLAAGEDEGAGPAKAAQPRRGRDTAALEQRRGRRRGRP
ncbi:amino acid adenylation domain-containing protein [Kitasatospora sp. NBC_01250]|uniref:amino acid adenylation domain-containing protein n=1 Tax=Kitasatospora sp. NBC_01250 TaxID=2903571 RepID=UPI002E33B2BE|nr:amino acid adenylation domain-containing protein [Kitasatospora sp. NBC_01250]